VFSSRYRKCRPHFSRAIYDEESKSSLRFLLLAVGRTGRNVQGRGEGGTLPIDSRRASRAKIDRVAAREKLGRGNRDFGRNLSFPSLRSHRRLHRCRQYLSDILASISERSRALVYRVYDNGRNGQIARCANVNSRSSRFGMQIANEVVRRRLILDRNVNFMERRADKALDLEMTLNRR